MEVAADPRPPDCVRTAAVSLASRGSRRCSQQCCLVLWSARGPGGVLVRGEAVSKLSSGALISKADLG